MRSHPECLTRMCACIPARAYTTHARAHIPRRTHARHSLLWCQPALLLVLLLVDLLVKILLIPLVLLLLLHTHPNGRTLWAGARCTTCSGDSKTSAREGIALQPVLERRGTGSWQQKGRAGQGNTRIP